jgi:hypothetical protein
MSTKSQHKSLISIDDSNLSPHTKKEYNFRFQQFLKNSPIKSLEELIDCPNKELESILVNYCKFLLKRVNDKELSPNTLPKQFKPIKFVLEVNYRENDIRWRPIEALFPPTERRSGYKAWTTEQIQEMEKFTKTTRNLALLHFMASVGVELEYMDIH